MNTAPVDSFEDLATASGNRHSGGGVQSATVLGQLGPWSFLVQLTGSTGTVCCELATPGEQIPTVGDRVLVSCDQAGQAYIMGFIRGRLRTPSPTAEPARLSTRDGASATHIVEGECECLQIRDRHDRVIFEYRPDVGNGTLSMSAGDVRLTAGRSLDLTAGEELRLFSGQGTRIRSLGSLRLSSESDRSTEIGLGHGVLMTTAEHFRCTADSGDIRLERGRFQGESLVAQLSSVRLIVTTLETVVTTIFERATDVFRRVTGLHQLKAGRIRTVSEDSYTVTARQVRLDGEEAVKLQGDKIHLG